MLRLPDLWLSHTAIERVCTNLFFFGPPDAISFGGPITQQSRFAYFERIIIIDVV